MRNGGWWTGEKREETNLRKDDGTGPIIEAGTRANVFILNLKVKADLREVPFPNADGLPLYTE